MLAIGGDGRHRLRRGAEQQIIDRRFVLPGNGGDLGRNAEDDMEIADRQEVGLALSQPGPRRSCPMAWCRIGYLIALSG
jgi:hypothetical protein